MTSNNLPLVLLHPRGSISMERALKQIKDLLEQYVEPPTDAAVDRLQASLDDIDTMLESLS